MTTTIVSILAGVLVLVLTVELLRRRALREKFAALWLVVSVVFIVFAFFPSAVGSLSRALGFQVPANFLFALGGLVLVILGMQLSLEIGRQEDRSQRLAEELALLRLEVEQLRDGTSTDGEEPEGPATGA